MLATVLHCVYMQCGQQLVGMQRRESPRVMCRGCHTAGQLNCSNPEHCVSGHRYLQERMKELHGQLSLSHWRVRCPIYQACISLSLLHRPQE